MKKRRFITLIEIMIVIVLIGIVAGALAFNMSGSLDEGKAFKSRQNVERVSQILEMAMAEGSCSGHEVEKNWKEVVKRSPLSAKNFEETCRDGWKEELVVKFNRTTENLTVSSKGLARYEKKKSQK